MKNDFNVQFSLPSGKTVRVYELTNKQYFNISKFCQNDDIEGLYAYIEHILPVSHLNVLDRLYALLNLYAVFIDSSISLLNRNKSQINFDLYELISKLDAVNIQPTKAISIDGFEFNVTIPKIAELDVFDCIESVSYSGITCTSDINEVLDHLPHNTFARLGAALVEYLQPLQSVLLVDADDTFEIAELRINLLSRNLDDIILALFKTNLDSILDMIFIFAQKFSSVNVFDLSLLDTRIMMNKLARQIKEQNDQISNQQGSTGPLGIR